MNKQEFLAELKNALSGLPKDEVEERIAFYGEMIDDRTEEGMTEEEAVAGIGTVSDVVSQILSEVPLTKIVRERVKPRRPLRGREIALIIIGFPLWFPLIVVAAAVVFSLYVAVWSIIVSLWAAELALVLCAFGGIAGAVVYACIGRAFPCVFSAGTGILCAGLSIFMFFCCKAATKGIIKLTKKAAIGIKTLFIKKEDA